MNLGQLTDKQRGTYAQVPIELILNSCISEGAVRLFAYAQWREGDGQNFEGRESIAEAMGVSEKTVSKYVAELEASDWMAVTRRNNKKGRSTNFYRAFETQSACRQWRTQNNQPKVARPIQPRKGREGIGGTPTHRLLDNKENLSSSSYQDGKENLSSPTEGDNENSNALTDGNSSSPTFGENGNSSSQHYPDSDSIQTQSYPDSDSACPTTNGDSPQGAAPPGNQIDHLGDDDQATRWGLSVGDTVYWVDEQDETRFPVIHEAVLKRFTPQMVVIELDQGGQRVEKLRKPTSLSKTRPELNRRTSTLQDVLAEVLWGIKPDQQIGKQAMIDLNTYQSNVLASYPKITPEHLRAALERKGEYLSRRVTGVLAAIGEYRDSLKSGSNGTLAERKPGMPRDLTLIYPENPLTVEQEDALIDELRKMGGKS